MADLGFSIKTEELPQAQNFDPVPEDNYNTMIVGSNFLPTNKTKDLMATNGVQSYDEYRKLNPKAEGFVVLEFDIQDGRYAGRKLFHNLNLINDSQEAMNISAGQLRQILEAINIKDFSGKTEELHGKRLTVKVKIKAAKPYKKDGVEKPGFPSNVCTGFMAYSGAATAATSSATASTPKGPWGR